jgi:hypothetical protein
LDDGMLQTTSSRRKLFSEQRLIAQARLSTQWDRINLMQSSIFSHDSSQWLTKSFHAWTSQSWMCSFYTAASHPYSTSPIPLACDTLCSKSWAIVFCAVSRCLMKVREKPGD